MKNAICFFICFLLFSLTYNCKRDKKALLESETKELLNTLWRLESFEAIGEEITHPPQNQIYNIQFMVNDILRGKSACNEIWAGYEVKPDNSLKIIRLVSTKLYCIDSMDDEYRKALIAAKSYEIDQKNIASQIN